MGGSIWFRPPHFLLRCVQLGISIADLDLLTIGLVNDIRNGRTTSIRIRNWHRRRTLTDSKAKKTDDRAYIANEISTIVWW